MLAVAASSPSGRPAGSRRLNAFGRNCIAAGYSARVLARALTQRGIYTSERAVRSWFIGEYKPSEDRIDAIVLILCSGSPTEAEKLQVRIEAMIFGERWAG
jgi:hypothetical protein